MEERKAFVSVDKQKIFYGIFRGVNWHFHGEYSEFKVHRDRCLFVDDEYAIILNMYGHQAATKYAVSKGYLIGDGLKTEV